MGLGRSSQATPVFSRCAAFNTGCKRSRSPGWILRGTQSRWRGEALCLLDLRLLAAPCRHRGKLAGSPRRAEEQAWRSGARLGVGVGLGWGEAVPGLAIEAAAFSAEEREEERKEGRKKEGSIWLPLAVPGRRGRGVVPSWLGRAKLSSSPFLGQLWPLQARPPS